jgi:hypothetical protein
MREVRQLQKTRKEYVMGKKTFGASGAISYQSQNGRKSCGFEKWSYRDRYKRWDQ